MRISSCILIKFALIAMLVAAPTACSTSNQGSELPGSILDQNRRGAPEMPPISSKETELSGPIPTVDRLAAPEMHLNPSQADLGAYVYYQICMACHGDIGQGLTDEWREVWEEDGNCWNLNCHGPDHPPEGFEIFDTCCPQVIGPGTLTRFQNGLELFIYNTESMPWWNPGSLKTEEFWQVTAFLMRANGALPDKVTLDAINAHAFNLHPADPLSDDQRPSILFVIGILISAATLLFLQKRLQL